MNNQGRKSRSLVYLEGKYTHIISISASSKNKKHADLAQFADFQIQVQPAWISSNHVRMQFLYNSKSKIVLPSRTQTLQKCAQIIHTNLYIETKKRFEEPRLIVIKKNEATYIATRIIKFSLTKQLMNTDYLLRCQRLNRHFWAKFWAHFAWEGLFIREYAINF